MNATKTAAPAERLVTVSDIESHYQMANDRYYAKLTSLFALREEIRGHYSAVAEAEEILRQVQQSTYATTAVAKRRLDSRSHRKGGKKRDGDSRKAVRAAQRDLRRAENALQITRAQATALYKRLHQCSADVLQLRQELKRARAFFHIRTAIVAAGIPLPLLGTLFFEYSIGGVLSMYYGGKPGIWRGKRRPQHGHVVVTVDGILIYHRPPFSAHGPHNYVSHPLFGGNTPPAAAPLPKANPPVPSRQGEVSTVRKIAASADSTALATELASAS